jgi:hypothetical protein
MAVESGSHTTGGTLRVCENRVMRRTETKREKVVAERWKEST